MYNISDVDDYRCSTDERVGAWAMRFKLVPPRRQQQKVKSSFVIRNGSFNRARFLIDKTNDRSRQNGSRWVKDRARQSAA